MLHSTRLILDFPVDMDSSLNADDDPPCQNSGESNECTDCAGEMTVTLIMKLFLKVCYVTVLLK